MPATRQCSTLLLSFGDEAAAAANARASLYVCLLLDNAVNATMTGQRLLSRSTARQVAAVLHYEMAVALDCRFAHRPAFSSVCPVCAIPKAVSLASRIGAAVEVAAFLGETREATLRNRWLRQKLNLAALFEMEVSAPTRWGRIAVSSCRKLLRTLERAHPPIALSELDTIWRGDDDEYWDGDAEALIRPSGDSDLRITAAFRGAFPESHDEVDSTTTG